MSKQILFIPHSNGSCSVSESSISKRVHDRKFIGRCFRGLDVTLLHSGTTMNLGRWFVRCPKWKNSYCSYFVWVDKIEGQWKALRRAFSKRKMHEDVLEVETEVKMLMKPGKIEVEIIRLRLWIMTMLIIVVLSFVCNVYLILSRF
ncbi:hypothetical protein Ahy_A09g043555 [Arachis hypogaea]|uniref:Zinc finger GRF-type domain-containing protein n=1 Tax=Arachis hypogaea TaxID=3818 RepID=A0A445BIL9_ARAHY|nr:hypothetical protein Ahy_A09g043555 [Arachis hypogaea]